MSPRKRRLDYALRSRQRGIWLATVAILVLGGLAIYFALSTGERRRMRVLDRLEPGDSATRVAEILGSAPRVCGTGSLEHLRTQFPPGWAPAALEAGIERIREQTAQRWIYPVKSRPGQQVGCGSRRGVTEIGLDGQERVLWYVPITGMYPVVLPPGLTPEAVDPEPTDEPTDG